MTANTSRSALHSGSVVLSASVSVATEREKERRQLFAANLRRIRHQKRVSQEQLAHDAEVDRAYLSRVERAVTFVGLEIIGKLADVLGWTRSSSSGDHPGLAAVGSPTETVSEATR